MMGDPKRMRQILKATMASVIFPLLYTTYGFITLHPKSETKGSYTRIVGTFIQSNDYGRYLMLMIIMGAALYPYISRRWQRWLGACMVLMCIYEFLTYTRSALIGCAVGLAIVGFKQSKRVLAGLLVVGFCGILLVPSLSGRFTDLTQYQSKQAAVAGTTASGDSFSWRISYWTEVLPLANSNPITGIGLDMTQYITVEAKQPHNDFIRAYVETGIIGFLCYLAMIIALVNLGRRATRVARKGTLEYGIAVGFLGCAAAFVLCSLVANVISNVVNLWYFVAFAAAANAVATRSTKPGWYGDEEPVPSATVPAIDA
jgi:putative inorganic carbon (HCO3(-)) transporter